MSNFREDLKNSVIVMKQIEPIICRLLKCDNLKTVEGVDNEVCKILDLSCGIDYLEIRDKTGQPRGIANRVQWVTGNPYNTFTIRKSRESGATTEFEKRKTSIKDGGLYPHLTMHTYVESGTNKLLSLGIARTTDIMNYIDNYSPKERMSVDEKGKAWFYCCSWDDMLDKGYYVLKSTLHKGNDFDLLFTVRPLKGA